MRSGVQNARSWISTSGWKVTAVRNVTICTSPEGRNTLQHSNTQFTAVSFPHRLFPKLRVGPPGPEYWTSQSTKLGFQFMGNRARPSLKTLCFSFFPEAWPPRNPKGAMAWLYSIGLRTSRVPISLILDLYRRRLGSPSFHPTSATRTPLTYRSEP